MSQPYDYNLYRCRIVKHVDGDTSHVVVDPGFDVSLALTVRWTGIDAPEIGTPEGKEALAWVQQALPEGSSCLLRTIKDRKEKYGRYLGEFLAGEGMLTVNEQMVAAGHAVAYDGGAR